LLQSKSSIERLFAGSGICHREAQKLSLLAGDATLVDCTMVQKAVTQRPPELDVIVETPRGSRNKFKFEPKSGKFRLGKVLPAGMVYPYDFGFVPDTKAEDGDPLDVLLLMDEPAFPGCIVEARVVGVIEAEQEENDETVRNDRLIAVATAAFDYAHIRTADDIHHNLLHELEQFFLSVNRTRGKIFRVLGTKGPVQASKVIKAAARARRRQAK
jgi:inorganic pyrophosphatase